jgi:hypothetical protein
VTTDKLLEFDDQWMDKRDSMYVQAGRYIVIRKLNQDEDTGRHHPLGINSIAVLHPKLMLHRALVQFPVQSKLTSSSSLGVAAKGE